MTLDEVIKREEELVNDHDRIKQIKAVTLEECRRAEEHRQLAEWLKELKTHREAWDDIKEGLLEMSRLHEYVSIKHMIQLIDKVRPKECDADET